MRGIKKLIAEENKRKEKNRQDSMPLYSQNCVDKLESELTALRSQVAELQRQLSSEQEAHAATIQREAKLSLQLDEAAGQEPYLIVESASKLGIFLTDAQGKRLDAYALTAGLQLYAKPVNLPAIIEQARAEEREAIEKTCEEIARGLSGTMGFKIAMECVHAIRARKP